MFYITADPHGDFHKISQYCYFMQTKRSDTMIILGDAGINYHQGDDALFLKRQLSKLKMTFFCIHGNHEERASAIPSYIEKVWHGGIVYYEPDFPSLLFAKDGEVYNIAGHKAIAIGGAYSIDKPLRLAYGYSWFANEQPDETIKSYVESQLEKHKWKVDLVLSHTVPVNYEPTEVFMQGIDQSDIDKSTEEWLDMIEKRLDYKIWYCGHYHTSKSIDKIRFMYHEINLLEKKRK